MESEKCQSIFINFEKLLSRLVSLYVIGIVSKSVFFKKGSINFAYLRLNIVVSCVIGKVIYLYIKFNKIDRKYVKGSHFRVL